MLVAAALGATACSDEEPTRAVETTRTTETTRTATAPPPKPEPVVPVLHGNDLDPLSSSTVRRGGLVTLFGYVTGGPVHRRDRDRMIVELWARPAGGEWRRVRSMRYGRGDTQFRVRPKVTTTYQIRVAGHPRGSRRMRIRVRE